MDSHPAAGLLVGRETELAQLELTLDRLDRGEAACVTVEGEPRIGKTRLLRELQARPDARGEVVLFGSASEFERDLPFSVFVGRPRRVRGLPGPGRARRPGRR